MILLLIYFYLFIKLFFKVFLLLFKYNLLLFKVVVIIISLSISLYIYLYPITRRLTLSKLKKWKYRFPNDYKLVTYKDHIINLSVIFLYIFICIFGILWLRFRNTDRVLDLKIYYDQLYNVFIHTSLFYSIVNILLLFCLLLLYRQLLRIGLNNVKHHFIIRHIFLCVNKVDNFYEFTIYWNFRRYIHLNNLHKIHDIIREIFHKLGLRKYPDRSEFYDDWSFKCRTTSPRYDTIFEAILTEFLRINIERYKYIIHYILLGLVTLYDLMFNDCILTNAFKIMPYIFIYDILVKICKWLDFNVTSNDGIIYGFLYEPWYEIHEVYVTFGTTTIDKDDMAKIITYYVYPGLQDIHHIWISGNTDKKSKDYMKKTKEIYNNIQEYLSSYRNNEVIMFYIWITFILSIYLL